MTLPLLLSIGLPPQVANATNRVAITLQTFAGVVTYHRLGVRPWRHLPPIAVPGVLGALLGAWAAATMEESLFRWLAAAFFIAMIATVFLDPKKWKRERTLGHIRPALFPIFFLLGLYGGFLQAGIGTLLIGTFVLLGGYDVVNGSALKFSLAMTWTAASTLLFAGFGQVQWGIGLLLAAGTMLGGVVGAKLVVARGVSWVRWVVVGSAILAIVQLARGS